MEELFAILFIIGSFIIPILIIALVRRIRAKRIMSRCEEHKVTYLDVFITAMKDAEGGTIRYKYVVLKDSSTNSIFVVSNYDLLNARFGYKNESKLFAITKANPKYKSIEFGSTASLWITKEKEGFSVIENNKIKISNIEYEYVNNTDNPLNIMNRQITNINHAYDLKILENAKLVRGLVKFDTYDAL